MMTQAESLLAAPPPALLLALAAMRQAGDLPCQVENADMPEYLIEFVAPGDHRALLKYLDAILAEPALSDADLSTLFARVAAGEWYPKSKGARELFAGLQRVLRNEMNNHG